METAGLHFSQKPPFLLCFLGLAGPPKDIEFPSISESSLCKAVKLAVRPSVK